MKERRSDIGRGLRSRWPAFAAVVGVAAFHVSVAATHAAEPPSAPPGFRLPAGNGYTLSVTALANPHTHRGVVVLSVRSPHANVFYSAPASVGPTSIDADLGGIGRIDVEFVPSGRSRIERSACGGEPVTVDSGHYEGSIDFEGEEGYSEVHAGSARGDATMALNLACPGGPRSQGFGGRSPGAQLTVRRRGARRVEFSAMKNSPTRPARFAASIAERRRDLVIFRSVEATAGPGAFDFDVPSGMAHVSPPRPFVGEGSYFRPSGKHATWRGDLIVDFPGQADVHLTGPGTRAGLIRSVINPSHPFRLR